MGAKKGNGYYNPWLGLVAGMFYQFAGGFIHGFPIFSSHFKDSLGYSQPQLQRINGLIKLGGLFAIVGGMVFDSPKYGGPRATGIGAIVLYGVGLWALYLGAIDNLPTPVEYWHICLASFLFGAGAVWGDTTAVCTNVLNFPDNKGSVVAFLKASSGIAAAVCSQYYLGLFSPEVVDFMRFVCFAYVGVFIVLLPLFKVIDPETQAAFAAADKNRNKHFKRGFFLIVLLALYCLVTGIFEKTIPTVTHSPPPSKLTRLILTIGMTVILFSLWTLAIGTGPIWMRSKADPESLLQNEHRSDDADPEKGTINRRGTLTRLRSVWSSKSQKTKKPTKIAEGLSFGEALLSPAFYMLMFTAISIEGGAMIFYSNLPQILQALGEDTDYAAIFVSIFSICSCAGRLTMPIVTDIYSSVFPRPYAVLLGVSLLCVCDFALGFTNSGLLYLMAVLTGFAHGSYTGSLPAVVVDVFGKRAYGTIYACFRLCPTLGVLIFAAQLFGSVYEGSIPEGADKCLGVECFRSAMLIMSACCGAMIFMCLLLIRQTRHIYSNSPPKNTSKVKPQPLATSESESN